MLSPALSLVALLVFERPVKRQAGRARRLLGASTRADEVTTYRQPSTSVYQHDGICPDSFPALLRLLDCY